MCMHVCVCVCVCMYTCAYKINIVYMDRYAYILIDAALTVIKVLSAVIPKAIQPVPFPSIIKSIKLPFFLHSK